MSGRNPAVPLPGSANAGNNSDDIFSDNYYAESSGPSPSGPSTSGPKSAKSKAANLGALPSITQAPLGKIDWRGYEYPSNESPSHSPTPHRTGPSTPNYHGMGSASTHGDQSETSTIESTDIESYTEHSETESASRSSRIDPAKSGVTSAILAARRANARYRDMADNKSVSRSISSAQSVTRGATKRRERVYNYDDDDSQLPSNWSEEESLDYAKYSVMVEHMYKVLKSKGWLDAPGDEGAVSLRVSSTIQAKVFRGDLPAEPEEQRQPRKHSAPIFVTFPQPNQVFARAVRGLNVEVAIMLTSKMIRLALEMVPEMNRDMRLRDGSRIQVLPALSMLPRARKLQYAALVREEGALVVWTNSIDSVIDSCEAVQDQLVKVFWSGLPQPVEGAEFDSADDETASANSDNVPRVREKEDAEFGSGSGSKPARRPYIFIWPIISTLALCTTTLFFGFGVKTLLVECMYDGYWARMALIALLPLQILFTQFVPQAAISCILMIFGPVKHLESNSQYYSGVPPKRIDRGNLPHITIQMPVYTESLEGVIDPTVQSLQKAISTYESQGGSASIFINEDGMQVIPPDEADRRKRYYAEHNIGWVARPKHKHNGYIRAGRFKKASNMNFCLYISRMLEDLLEQEPELDYEDALEIVLRKDGRAWAAGDIQMGDIILLVDCDTRVPEDCFLDAASEFQESPDVAIMQHTAAPMIVTYNYFELGIAFFTKIIYWSIRYCCASGETSPFVGHNAFLRWSAIKEVGFEEEGIVKYWSEEHVSEDFDMSLRLQINGYKIRYIAYCGDGFQEGVSLTVYDEVGRWQKYAYGCSELVFHPLKSMLFKGVFTPLFRKFVTSNMFFYSKVNIIGYIGSYYAIGAAWILTLSNYFLVGYFDDILDKYYLPSFDVLFTTLIVFTLLSNISFAVYRYRLKELSLISALWENISWIPFFAVFFSGLSFHVSLALVSHLIGYNMTWGSTAKELENSNFFKEVPKVFWGYKRMYLIFILLTAMMPVLVYVPPAEWTINGLTLILPASLVFGGHLLLPIALNPSLMTFSF